MTIPTRPAGGRADGLCGGIEAGIEGEAEGEAKVPRHSFEEDFQMTPGRDGAREGRLRLGRFGEDSGVIP